MVDQPDSLRLSHLQFRDMNPGERYTREEVFALTKRLYAKLFFKDVPDAATAELGFQLFDFIDRTGAFHDHRLANTTNPYYRRAAHASLAPALLDRRCRLIPPVDLDGEGGVLLDPIEDEVLRVGEVVKQAMRHLVAHFDAGRTLRANVDEAWAAAATLLPEGAADCREWDDLVLRLINTSAIYPA